MRSHSVLLVVLAACAAAPLFAAPAYVRMEQQGNRWRIGNDFVERTVSFSEDDGLRTESLVRKSSGTDFTAYGRQKNEFGPEFSFSVNGNHLDGHRSFRFGNAESIAIDGGRALRVVLHDRKGMLDVTVYYAVFDRYPAIRKWISITNKSTSAITLTHLCFEALSLGAGSPGGLAAFGRLRRGAASTLFHGARFRCGDVPAKFADRRRRERDQRGAGIPQAHRSGTRLAGRAESDVRHRSFPVRAQRAAGRDV